MKLSVVILTAALAALGPSAFAQTPVQGGTTRINLNCYPNTSIKSNNATGPIFKIIFGTATLAPEYDIRGCVLNIIGTEKVFHLVQKSQSAENAVFEGPDPDFTNGMLEVDLNKAARTAVLSVFGATFECR